MASSATPYGLLPVKRMGENPFTHGVRRYKIASGYAANIFYGDVVKIVNGGTIQKDTGTTSLTPIGVFLGVEYTDATYGLTFRQMWATGTVASDAYAYVCDDPFTLFQVQASGAIDQTGLGTNAAVVQGSGSTATGKSAVTLNASTLATTSTLPLRIVDFVNSTTSSIGDAYTDVIVKFNNHQLTGTTGTATS